MLYPVIFIFLSLILLMLFLLIKVNILLEYLRNGWNEHIIISFFVLRGLIKYKYEIPLVDLEKDGLKFRKVKEKGSDEKDIKDEKEFVKFKRIYENYKALRRFYYQNIESICNIRSFLRGRLVLRKFDLKVALGTGDACLTGLVAGLIWSLAGIVVSWLENSFKTDARSVDVKVDYMEKKFKIDLYCIFNIKIVHIIVVGFKLSLSLLNTKLKQKMMTGGGVSG